MSAKRVDKAVGGDGDVPDSIKSSEDAPIRRERSPSAMSHSSGVLEWDPSADVGTVGASREKDDLDQKGQLSTLQRHASEVQVLYVGPSFDLEGRQSSSKPPSESSSRHASGSSANSQKSKAYAYSTPSGSPVPLATLQYSPVPAQATATSKEKDSNANVLEKPEEDEKNQESKHPTPPPVAVSSDDNNNDGTEEKRTPSGRVVSDASTDWEYDREKIIPSKSMSQWQTSGMTRSEIAYQNKKNSGSSTSAASSVFLLKVDANINNEGQESLPAKSKSRRNQTTSPPKCDDHIELERRIHSALSRQRSSHHKHAHEDTGSRTSGSDPSSMCVLVDDFVKLLESDPGKENIKYDVLKSHRDYHLMKVWKQISKLEKLNMNLMSYKQGRRPETMPKPIPTSQKQKTSSQQEVEDIIKFYTKRAPKIQDVKRRPKQSSHFESHSHSDIRTSSSDRSYPSRRDAPSSSSTRSPPQLHLTHPPQYPAPPPIQLPPPPPKRKSPVGFFIPLLSDESGNSGSEMEDARANNSGKRFGHAKSENGFYDVKGMPIQDWFIKNNPHCYKNVKERDDFLIHVKRDRQVYNETVLREILQSQLSQNEVEQYLQRYIAKATTEEKRRLETYWDQYMEAQNFKENVQSDHIIPLREMKERTARLRRTDPVVLDREKKEAEERRRQASRALQKDFSSNLRRFQRMGKVNVPDRLKLSTR